jgi:ATP-dependent Clp protease ATP-binding subunit ClpA
MTMFERFSEPARAVLVTAEAMAIELRSPNLTPGHLLYGCAEAREETAGRPLRDAGITESLIRGALPRTADVPGGPIDPDALRAIGIDYDGVREAVEQTFGAGALESAPDRRLSSDRVRKPRFTPEAKRSLQLSLQVAVELRDRRIRPGHLLLGLLRLDDDLVAGIVEQAGTSIASLSAAVLTRLAAEAA